MDKNTNDNVDLEQVKELKIVISQDNNPWYNLALEEYLLNGVSSGEVILYLWQNENTVVIGRNQNAWKECRCELFEEEGGRLARRLSGGGAVYHDLGNLNFTFIIDRELYDLKTQLSVILDAVRKQGIDAEFSGRNDLLAGEKKFSGNAFYFSGDTAYHHGTVLVDSDFVKLTRYLQVSNAKIRSKGIDSVRSRVVNLKEINTDLTITDMRESLEKSFAEIYGAAEKEIKIERDEIAPTSFAEIEELYKKYSSWEWRYGETPEFDITFNNKFDWGEMELGLKLKKGYIEKAVIYSDAMHSELIQEIAGCLKNTAFKMEDIFERLTNLQEENNDEKAQLVEDIKEWLKTRLF